MTAPVTPLPQAARPGRAQDRPDPTGGAGFASALDGVLSSGREPAGPSAAEQRNNRRDPQDRATDRIDRAIETAAAAADRAAERLERAADRAAEQTERAADHAAASDEPTTDPDDATDDAPVEEPVPADAAPGRTGLPAALWALLTGAATTPQPTGTPT